MSGYENGRHHRLNGNASLLSVTVLLVCATIASVFLLFNKTPAANSTALRSSAVAVQQTAAAPSQTSSKNAAQSSSQISSSEISSSSQAKEGSLENAVFIGDSITSGLSVYGNIDDSVVFTKNGMTAYTAVTRKYTFNGEKQVAADAAAAKNPTCVYILLGSNDISQGYSETKFTSNYGKLIDNLKAKCPSAKIYVQSIFPVTAGYADRSGVTNEKIDKFNSALKNLCSEKGAVFTDVASIMKDADGTLIADASSDGLHIKKSWYGKWVHYITVNQ